MKLSEPKFNNEFAATISREELNLVSSSNAAWLIVAVIAMMGFNRTEELFLQMNLGEWASRILAVVTTFFIAILGKKSFPSAAEFFVRIFGIFQKPSLVKEKFPKIDGVVWVLLSIGTLCAALTVSFEIYLDFKYVEGQALAMNLHKKPIFDEQTIKSPFLESMQRIEKSISRLEGNEEKWKSAAKGAAIASVPGDEKLDQRLADIKKGAKLNEGEKDYILTTRKAIAARKTEAATGASGQVVAENAAAIRAFEQQKAAIEEKMNAEVERQRQKFETLLSNWENEVSEGAGKFRWIVVTLYLFLLVSYLRNAMLKVYCGCLDVAEGWLDSLWEILADRFESIGYWIVQEVAVLLPETMDKKAIVSGKNFRSQVDEKLIQKIGTQPEYKMLCQFILANKQISEKRIYIFASQNFEKNALKTRDLLIDLLNADLIDRDENGLFSANADMCSEFGWTKFESQSAAQVNFQ